MSTKTITIGKRIHGEGAPCYMIAEMSANHGQSFDQALRIVHAAKASGADAIKLQTYTPDTLTLNCRTGHFLVGPGSIWEGRSLYDLYGEAYTPWEWQPKLKRAAEEIGLDCFSTPFDFTAVDFLEQMGVVAYKIASFELVDLPLIRRVAQTGKPTIMSTGMASLTEIDEAVRAYREAGGAGLALLKCTSAYPSLPDEMNLLTIPHLAESFGVAAGLSDHTLGIAVPVAAVVAGASIIEKHFTMDRRAGGPDSSFSLEPHEFKSMVETVRLAEKAMGQVNYKPTVRERASREFRRSLFAVEDIKSGEVLTLKNVRSIRPAAGLSPKHLEALLGCRAVADIPKGTPLTWNLVSGTDGRSHG